MNEKDLLGMALTESLDHPKLMPDVILVDPKHPRCPDVKTCFTNTNKVILRRKGERNAN